MSVAEDASDDDGINKLVQQDRSDYEALQPHGIWAVIQFSMLRVASGDICTSINFTGGLSRAKFPQDRSAG
ncbi:hypothetical protein E4U58_005134 [Claviceps cyperi]|nr:hypothetical protein E4U58_005134 [Claviceps cyperi]